eukprot:s4632_g2.t1
MGRHGAKKSKRSHAQTQMPMMMVPTPVASGHQSSSSDDDGKSERSRDGANPPPNASGAQAFGVQRVLVPRNSTTIRMLGLQEVGRLIEFCHKSCDAAWQAALTLTGR